MRFIGILTRLLVLAGLMIGPANTAISAGAPPGLQVVASGPAGILLSWIAPPVQVQTLPGGSLALRAGDLPRTTQPGSPQLPFAAALLAVPPGATPRLRIVSISEGTMSTTASLALAPRPDGVVRDAGGRPVSGAFAPEPEAAGSSPSQAASIEDAGVVQGVRLIRLVLYPALPAADGWRLVRGLTVAVDWEGRAAAPAPSGPAAEGADPVLDVVRRSVLNPWEVVPAAVPPQSPIPLVQPDVQTLPSVFVEITATGVYSLPYETLAPLGLAGGDPHNLRLYHGPDEVAYGWQGDEDAQFEPGESLMFYAEPRFSRWTATDTLRLVADVVPGLRMGSQAASPTGLPAGLPWTETMAEQNVIYMPDCFCGHQPAGRDGDRWAWADLREPGNPTATFSINAPSAAPNQAAVLTLWMIGYTAVTANTDHRVAVAVNGQALGESVWDGKQAITATLSIRPGVLVASENLVTLSLPGLPGVEVEGVYLDALQLQFVRSQGTAGESLVFGTGPAPVAAPGGPYRVYLPLVTRGSTPGGASPRAYTASLAAAGPYVALDVTDPLRPRRLTGVQAAGQTVTLGDPPEGGYHRYEVTGRVLRPAAVRKPVAPVAGGVTGAGYLIVTHPDFAPALAPLVTLRQSQGFTVTVANLQGIYDAYGQGRVDPEAIRAFLGNAYASWTPRPAYVLLVGDGSFDPRRYRPDSPPTYLPPYLADVDPWAGEVAADNRYVTLDGNDLLPDVLIGRLAVRTVTESQVVVQKIVGYETAPPTGDLRAAVTLVADKADTAGDFPALSAAMASAYVTAPYTATQIAYLGGDTVTATRLATLDAWQAGAFLYQFMGHSSWQQWATDNLFSLDLVPSLANSGRLPVLVEMTCFTGAFQRPEPTLDKALVNLPGGGAVAAWGPTGLGVGTGHDWLDKGFFGAVFRDGVATVGEAALAGKLALAAQGLHLDLLDTFTLQGDPASRLIRPAAR
jgi:hypothetical protein